MGSYYEDGLKTWDGQGEIGPDEYSDWSEIAASIQAPIAEPGPINLADYVAPVAEPYHPKRDRRDRTGRKIWATFVACFLFVAAIRGIIDSPVGGIALIPVWFLIWAIVTCAPFIFDGIFESHIDGRGI
jgi:hypothetical protein